MKKILLIFIAIFAALALFLFVVYFVATKGMRDEAQQMNTSEQNASNDTFKNPQNAESPLSQSTSTITGSYFINGTTTITTTTETFPTIPASIVYENAANNNDNVVLSIDNVGQSSDGTVAVSFRLITSGATQPASIDPAELIKITTAEGSETLARIIEGNFSNVAAGQILTGRVIFFLPQKNGKIIFQIGKEERVMFYEFDFTKNTYKQADIS